MAQTAEGRALTEAHRREQLAVAARADLVGRALWPELDVADLDRSTPGWLGASVVTAAQFYDDSAQAAAVYVSKYRAAELGADTGPIVQAEFNTAATTTALLLAGPVRVKALIGQGLAPDAALDAAVTKYVGILRRQVLMGGRETVALTARTDQVAVGYRRVSDGDPCAFCAMLVGRGPVYKSDIQAGSPLYGEAARFHGHCGCTVEVVYGDWTPTPEEQAYVDAYEDAAAQVEEAGQPKRTSNILPLMRSNGEFRDSGIRRNKRGY